MTCDHKRHQAHAHFLLYFGCEMWQLWWMADHPSKSHERAAVQGQDLDGNVIEEFKSTPAQLSLFQDAFAPGASSTIELYDAMPKYFASTKEMESLRREHGGQFLETLCREFVYRGAKYSLTMRPARIKTRQATEREFYATEREHLIEHALRKLAVNQLNGIYLGDHVAVQFSLSELRRELARTGHAMNYPSLIEGLQICNAAHLTLTPKDGTSEIKSTIFPLLIKPKRSLWEQDPKSARCYVKFHPLVTVSVEELTFRQMNYEMFMRLDRSLSRYLFQRLSHLYVQAHFNHPYHLALDTILRDSGMTISRETSENVKRVEKALHELKDKDVLMAWSKQENRGPHNRIVDVVYSLLPSREFANDMIESNRRANRVHQLQSECTTQRSR